MHKYDDLFVAINADDADAINELVASGVNLEQQRNERTPLVHAAMTNRIKAVKALLSGGADPDATNSLGWTALCMAIDRGFAELAIVLVENGANTNTVDSVGIPPLHLAIGRLNLRLIYTLLEHGADPNTRDKDGLSAFDRLEQGYQDLINLMKKYPRTRGGEAA